jgi:hypothetical protein
MFPIRDSLRARRAPLVTLALLVLNLLGFAYEVQSGPVFKAVAGRTRRNSGLPNALCRPCSEVTPLEHSYAFESSLSGG